MKALALSLSCVLLLVGCEPQLTGSAPEAQSAAPSGISTPGSGDAGPKGEGSRAAEEPAPVEKRIVYVQPLGPEIPDADAKFVETSLLAFYDMRVVSLPRIALPDSTRNKPKTRYRAEKILRLLKRTMPDDGFRILGLTGIDISTSKGKVADWGILGLATIDGEACVISTFRTKRGTKTAGDARIRLGKVAVHEIGHTLGQPHCKNTGCLMEDAQGTVMTTDQEYDLCSDCRRRLSARGHELADPSLPIPWPEP